MTAEVFTVPPDMTLQEAAREMAGRWIRHLPVVDDGRAARRGQHARHHRHLRRAGPRRTVAVEHEFDQLVRERRLARIEQGDLD